MPVGRIASILLLAGTAAACGGDDTAARDCQQPGDPKRQAEACTRVIASDPKSGKAYNNRCLAYNQMDQHDKALADCNQAIRLDPNNASAYNNRGWAYEMTRQYDPALKDYSKAIQLDPKFATAYANRGDVYSKTGDKKRAIAEYRLALEIDPRNDVALNGLKRLGARP